MKSSIGVNVLENLEGKQLQLNPAKPLNWGSLRSPQFEAPNYHLYKLFLVSGVLLDSHHSNTLLPSSTYKTVLVEFSMSGDNNEIDDVLYAGFEESVMSEVNNVLSYQIVTVSEGCRIESQLSAFRKCTDCLGRHVSCG